MSDDKLPTTEERRKEAIEMMDAGVAPATANRNLRKKYGVGLSGMWIHAQRQLRNGATPAAAKTKARRAKRTALKTQPMRRSYTQPSHALRELADMEMNERHEGLKAIGLAYNILESACLEHHFARTVALEILKGVLAK